MLNRDITFFKGFHGWNGRLVSMTLFPLSLIVAIIIQRLSYKLRLILLSFIIVSSVLLSFQVYLNYGVGWARNRSMVNYLKNNKYLKNKNIVYINNASDLTVFGTDMDAFYELESCARLAYGNDTSTKFENYDVPNYKSFILDDRRIQYIPDST